MVKNRLYFFSIITVFILSLAIVTNPLSASMATTDTKLIVRNSNQPLGKLGMIVIVDALNLTILQMTDTPNITYLINEGLGFLNASTILPSATTAAHVAMITGAPPEINGVVHTVAYNATEYHLAPIDESPIKYNFRDMLRVDTLLEVVKAQGVKVGLIVSKSKLEIMSGRTYAVDRYYLLPDDVIDGDPHEPDYPIEKRKTCMEWITNATLETIDSFYQYILNGESALIVTHYAEPDYVQGAFGVDSPETIEMIEFIDAQIGRILKKLQDLNLWSRTFMILTADHSFVNVNYADNLLGSDNTHLSAIHTEHIVQETAGLLLFIYLKYPEKTQEVVNELKKYPWARNIWTRIPVENATGTLSDIGLDIDYAGDIVLDINPPYYASKYYGLGGHGGTITKTIPIIFAGGLLVKKSIDTPNITDIGPTMAKVFGATLPNATGRAFDIIATTAKVSLSASPGIASPGDTVSIELNYTITGPISDGKAKIVVYNSTGSEIVSDEKSISDLEGSLTFNMTLNIEDTYTIYGYIVDGDGKILGGGAVNVLVISIAKPGYPYEKVVIGFAITIALFAVLIAIPIYFEKIRKKLVEE